VPNDSLSFPDPGHDPMNAKRSSRLLAAFLLLALPAAAQVDDLFRQGVDHLSRGQNEEALAAFQKVLAEDPSNQVAFELWQSTSSDVWLKLLTLGGDYEQVAKRFLEIATLGRKERRNDEEAIRAALTELETDDVAARQKTFYRIGAEFGEYAVPYMVHSLGESADQEKRVITMQALAHMGDDVVLPLIEAALGASDSHLRRNAALTLGYIGDPRANAALAQLVATDESEPVRSAAQQSLAKCGGSADAVGQFLALGDAYYEENDSVLQPQQYSDVVWTWSEKGLEGIAIPRFLYAPELAKRAYLRALEASPSATRAVAGLARSVVTQRIRLEQWKALGQETGDWDERLNTSDIAVELAGEEALDLALGWAVDQDDAIAASGLCKALARVASAPTANLAKALGNKSAAVRGEAAVALGRIACITNQRVDARTLAALNEAASREVLQIAAVIDSDAARRASFEAALEGRGLMVNSWTNGLRGLTALRAVPAIDMVLVAGSLPDVTAHQVISELRADPRTRDVPIFIVDSNPDADKSIYGDAVTGVLASASDLDQTTEAMSARMNKDREEAVELAARAAGTLARLAELGLGDLASSAAALGEALANPSMTVVAPALEALAAIGGAEQVPAILATLSDAQKPEEIRILAAEALGGIFARGAGAEPNVVESLRTLATTDGSLEIRKSVARALGRLNLSPEVRSDLIRGLRS
jgi:HEAT repeat protein